MRKLRKLGMISVLIETSLKTILGLSALPGPVEWERFRFYARRVQRLVFGHSNEREFRHKTSTRLFAELLISRPPTILLPNLRQLEWYDDRKHTLSYISLFLSPSLNTLYIPNTSDTRAKTLYNLLYSHGSSLQNVQISGGRLLPSKTTRTAFSKVLATWHDLTDLRFNHHAGGHVLSSSDLGTLARCGRLQRLSFSLSFDSRLPTLRETLSTQEACFPSLRRLEVSLLDPAALQETAEMIKVIRSQEFEEFGARFELNSPAQTQELLGALVTHTQLKKLTLWGSDPVTTSIILDPLSQLANLTDLSLARFDSLQLTKPVFDKMARSWPKIKTLEWIDSRNEHQSPLDISDLQVLAQCCPDLTYISIPFRSTLEDGFPLDLPIRRLPNVPLTVAKGSCRFENAMATAIYLSSMFPAVCIAEKYDRRANPLREAVNTVKRIRAQERVYSAL